MQELPKRSKGFFGGGDNARIVGQAEIVIGTDHDQLFAVYLHPCAGGRRGRTEIGIEIGLNEFSRAVKPTTLVEEIQTSTFH